MADRHPQSLQEHTMSEDTPPKSFAEVLASETVSGRGCGCSESVCALRPNCRAGMTASAWDAQYDVDPDPAGPIFTRDQLDAAIATERESNAKLAKAWVAERYGADAAESIAGLIRSRG